MGASVVGRRVPLEAFVPVPIVVAAHDGVNEVQSSPLSGFCIGEVASEVLSRDPRCLQVVLGRLLRPVWLSHDHPAAGFHHVDQRFKSISVPPENPAGTDT